MLKNKEYIFLTISAIICCVFQYYILAGTHKVGRDNWPYVFFVSLIMFFVFNFLYKKSSKKMIKIIIFVIMIFIPFMVYTLIEWFSFPTSLLNTINNNAVFYFFSVTFLSGGWIYSIFLVINSKYRKKLEELSS